jgi:hypothetical protein
MITVAGKRFPDLPRISIILMPGDLIRQDARNYAFGGSSYLMRT